VIILVFLKSQVFSTMLAKKFQYRISNSLFIKGNFVKFVVFQMILFYPPELIGAEGTWLLRDKREVGDPTGGNAEEAPIPPRGKQVPGVEINGKSYGLKTPIYAKRAL